MNLGDRVALVMIIVGIVLGVGFGDWRPLAVCALVGVIIGIMASAEGASSRGRKVREGQLVQQARAARGYQFGTQLHEDMETYVRAEQGEQDSSGKM